METEEDRQNTKPIEVMFDGACPLCKREISFYQKLKSTEDIAWIDVSTCDFQAPSGMTKKQLMQRFHLITPDGKILSGAAAFVFVWKALPGWRWISKFSRIPGMLPLMEWLYRGFLVVRPALQMLFRLKI